MVWLPTAVMQSLPVAKRHSKNCRCLFRLEYLIAGLSYKGGSIAKLHGYSVFVDTSRLACT